ncbi:MAG: segregation/condensation protein A, partial [Anaerolineae bacterium]|nr:segregation/condensation protein A [Anaerolineae bacterium]
ITTLIFLDLEVPDKFIQLLKCQLVFEPSRTERDNYSVEVIQTVGDATNAYTVELPDFEGPLDLLLNLIEREELDVTKISLARVTDQYLAYLDILREVNPDELTDFLVVAAKLILIKSEVLLPRPPASVIEDEEEDVGDELARQLLLYKQFKALAGQFKEIEDKGQRSFVRVAPLTLKIEPKLIPGAHSVADLLQAAREALAIKPPDPDVDEVVSPEVVTIGQQMAHIRQEIGTNRQVSFQKLLTRSHSRLEIIVTLLAVLELIKRRLVRVEQTGLFGDIVISQNEISPQLTEAEWAELTGMTDVS